MIQVQSHAFISAVSLCEWVTLHNTLRTGMLRARIAHIGCQMDFLNVNNVTSLPSFKPETDVTKPLTTPFALVQLNGTAACT